MQEIVEQLRAQAHRLTQVARECPDRKMKDRLEEVVLQLMEYAATIEDSLRQPPRG